MNKYKVTGLDAIDFEMEVAAKYNERDRVVYLDVDGLEKVGTISVVSKTDVHPWCTEAKPLYMLSTSPCLRGEEDIIELRS